MRTTHLPLFLRSLQHKDNEFQGRTTFKGLIYSHIIKLQVPSRSQVTQNSNALKAGQEDSYNIKPQETQLIYFYPSLLFPE